MPLPEYCHVNIDYFQPHIKRTFENKKKRLSRLLSQPLFGKDKNYFDEVPEGLVFGFTSKLFCLLTILALLVDALLEGSPCIIC